MIRNRPGGLLEWGTAILIFALPFLVQTDYYFNQFFIALFISAGMLAARVIFKKTTTVSLSDLVVAVFVAVCLLNLLFVRKGQPDELLYYEGITWIVVYALARNFKRECLSILLYAIMAAGVLQSLAGLLQYMDIIPPHHVSFKLLGSFPNPGLYGGYLAMSLIACVCLLVKRYKDARYAAILSVCAIFMACMLVLSDSRAAWVACVSGLLFLLCTTSAFELWRKKIGKQAASFGILAIVVACIAGLYGYKKDSADGRLLIWRVSMDMISDSPLTGHGLNSFPALYMNYQGRYLRAHPDTGYQRLADNNTQAFNEFIKVACELGVVGVAIVITLLCVVLFGKGNPAVIAILLALTVFSLFSYPTEFFTMGVFFALLIGLCNSRRLYSVAPPARILPIAVCLVMLCVAVCGGRTLVRYHKAFDCLYAQKPDVVLHRNMTYMSVYSKSLFDIAKYEMFIACVDRADFPLLTAEIKCDMGSAYWELGDTLKAEAAFIEAMDMVPSKIWPRYLLFVLYRNCDRVADARRMASVILNSDIKIVGSIALKAKKEALEYLNP